MSLDVASLGLPSEPMSVLELADEAQTRALGARLAAELAPGDFIGLVGTLGAGKTTLVQGLVSVLVPQAYATSPTYGLLHVYEGATPIFHVDLYRLETLEDLESMGYWDYAGSDEGILCVEWLDRIPEAWPGRGLVIELTHEQGRRRARIWASPGLRDRGLLLG
jgi:tRNA threonylcarbamoyladenosine biosynthesis protein TsaE